jgi:hypothetical protein
MWNDNKDLGPGDQVGVCRKVKCPKWKEGREVESMGSFDELLKDEEGGPNAQRPE